MKGLFVIAVVLVAACGGGGYGSTTPPPPDGNTPPPTGAISVRNNLFSPADKTIAAGSSVQWSWNSCSGDPYYGQTCVSHSVTFDDGVTSPTKDRGSYSRTFTTAGSYSYHCSQHPTVMMGTITVNP